MPFICCDMPQADRTMIQMYAVMAEWEARQISSRTKAALAAAKARGVKLGRPENFCAGNSKLALKAKTFAETLRPLVEPLLAAGMEQRDIVDGLNAAKVPTPSGSGRWHQSSLNKCLRRLRDAT